MKKQGPLGDSIKSILSGLQRDKTEELVKTWEGAVGEKAARHAKINFLNKGRLIIHVSDSTWLYQLTLTKQKILQELNSKQQQKIKEIQFRIGKI